MAKQGAIVRKLNSVETLGCTSVICSDKTGTLTTNQMSVRKVVVLDAGNKFLELDITGNTYGPEGQVFQNGNLLKNINVNSEAVNELSKVCVLCNDSKIVIEDGDINRIGEPTEAALLSLVEKLGSDDQTLNSKLGDLKGFEDVEKLSEKEKANRVNKVGQYYRSQFNRSHLFEFSRDRKSMSVVVQKGKEQILYCKGAPESIIERCDTILVGSKVVKMTKKMQNMLIEKAMEYGEDALRVLGFAMKLDPEIPSRVDSLKFTTYESGMTFLGLVGMLDPPRPQVKKSIQQCRDAGIRVIVITGDNKKTAESVCRQIGIFEHGESVEGKSFTGQEFDHMSDEEKRLAVMRGKVFSRTEPTHKSHLVDLLKSMGCIVAMTGDGVNDAPALKKVFIVN
jgi:Ca2+ transporting ATPase